MIEPSEKNSDAVLVLKTVPPRASSETPLSLDSVRKGKKDNDESWRGVSPDEYEK